ncbi:MAG: hypothetical protein J3K34DRAFT_140568 [Monoraphidium minutum]|nr:MAG: hypothetical protein J3K34DRAFT_140568 [Monoraphidium minutum]
MRHARPMRHGLPRPRRAPAARTRHAGAPARRTCTLHTLAAGRRPPAPRPPLNLFPHASDPQRRRRGRPVPPARGRLIMGGGAPPRAHSLPFSGAAPRGTYPALRRGRGCPWGPAPAPGRGRLRPPPAGRAPAPRARGAAGPHCVSLPRLTPPELEARACESACVPFLGRPWRRRGRRPLPRGALAESERAAGHTH